MWLTLYRFPKPLSKQVHVEPPPASTHTDQTPSRRSELAIWLGGLRSFFDLRNQPFTEADQQSIISRNWVNEVRIARSALLISSEIALQLAEEEASENALLETPDPALALSSFPYEAQAAPLGGKDRPNQAAVPLANSLYDLSIICESLLYAPSVSFSAWSSFGRLLSRELDQSTTVRECTAADNIPFSKTLQPELSAIVRRDINPSALGSDIYLIFASLARLLERLRVIADFIRRDVPLKQTLPIFSAVYEDTRSLLDFIEMRALHTVGIEEVVLNSLDSTHYIMSLELRKAFTMELAGVCSLRQASQIFLKVDAAHGLLRTCYQQSTIALAQLFNPSIKGTDLFASIQVALEQSIILRRDLFTLLQLVRHAQASETKVLSSSPFGPFRDVSLRFLKYRDREEYDRFIDEIAAARAPGELATVLHRFEAYLETLFGCVNMRAILANHPFEFDNPISVRNGTIDHPNST